MQPEVRDLGGEGVLEREAPEGLPVAEAARSSSSSDRSVDQETRLLPRELLSW